VLLDDLTAQGTSDFLRRGVARRANEVDGVDRARAVDADDEFQGAVQWHGPFIDFDMRFREPALHQGCDQRLGIAELGLAFNDEGCISLPSRMDCMTGGPPQHAARVGGFTRITVKTGTSRCGRGFRARVNDGDGKLVDVKV
jgi:hypothetical protein